MQLSRGAAKFARVFRSGSRWNVGVVDGGKDRPIPLLRVEAVGRVDGVGVLVGQIESAFVPDWRRIASDVLESTLDERSMS